MGWVSGKIVCFTVEVAVGQYKTMQKGRKMNLKYLFTLDWILVGTVPIPSKLLLSACTVKR